MEPAAHRAPRHSVTLVNAFIAGGWSVRNFFKFGETDVKKLVSAACKNGHTRTNMRSLMTCLLGGMGIQKMSLRTGRLNDRQKANNARLTAI